MNGFTQNAATTLSSSTPVRKIVIRLKTPTNPNTIILNGETNSQKMNRKRVSDEIKKPTHTFKKRRLHVEKPKNLLTFVNSQGKPACPLCRENCVSNKSLYQHMAFHTDKDWKRFTRSLNTHNFNKSGEEVVDLSKCLFGWDVKKGKRSRLGSRVADVKVNKVPNAKYYLGFGRFDLEEVDEDVQEAAKILVLMARDHQFKSKTSMTIQREEAAAKCLMCLDDPDSPPIAESGTQVEELMATSMTDRNLQVKELADTVNDGIKGVRGFDLNELPAFEDVSLTE